MPATTPTTRTYWSLGVTPAQSWIAEARRSRDLLAGSRILAWLMGSVLWYLKGGGATILLPQVRDEDLASLSGRFSKALTSGSTAITNHASGYLDVSLKRAEKLFRDVSSSVVERWGDLRCLAGYLREEAFPSTSEIAASDWLWRSGAPDSGRSRGSAPLGVPPAGVGLSAPSPRRASNDEARLRGIRFHP